LEEQNMKKSKKQTLAQILTEAELRALKALSEGTDYEEEDSTETDGNEVHLDNVVEEDESEDKKVVEEDEDEINEEDDLLADIEEDDSETDGDQTIENDGDEEVVVEEDESEDDKKVVDEDESEDDKKVVDEDESEDDKINEEDDKKVVDEDESEDDKINEATVIKARLLSRINKLSPKQIGRIYEYANDAFAQEADSIIRTLKPSKTTVKGQIKIENLIAEEAGLSDGFKEKAVVIFEAAVAEKLTAKIDKLNEDYSAKVRIGLQENYDRLVGRIDRFLTTVVEEWVAENTEAVDKSLRTDITESFINSLKDVFNKHYITMPEGRTDLFEDMSKKASRLEEQVERQAALLAKKTKALESLRRDKIVNEISEGLYDSQADKLKKLSESIEFVDSATFRRKLSLISEHFIKHGKGDSKKTSADTTKVRTLVEETDGGDDSEMGKYADALSRHMKKL